MFQFDPEKTKALHLPLERIELDHDQEQLLRDLTALVSPRIGLDPIPCHGLWLRAVRGWQIRFGKPAAAITRMVPQERVRAAMEIRDIFVELATEMLRSFEQHAALRLAIQDGFDLYIRKYSRRPG